ncbi:MAG: putative capsular polysaccharide synthesis family protein [Microthrixaceae bacterium]
MRDLLRRVARRSYPLTKWRLLRRMERERGDPIVVFCMGKTASSAIYRAVRDAVDRPVYKIHLLDPGSVARAEGAYRRSAPADRPRHVFHAAHLMRHLPTTDQPWDVITLVREPVMRTASDFFQSGRRTGLLRDDKDLPERLVRFAATQGIPRSVSWFDAEFALSLGVDVYAHPFDPAVGYGVIEAPTARVLILRQESLDVAPRAIAEFLGLSAALAIDRENEASTKEYRVAYEAVLREARFPAAVLDAAYESRFARHFYSADELARFRQRWAAADSEISDSKDRELH